MTEWTKQAEEMFAAWSNAQKSLMDRWVESVKSMSGAQDPQLWKKTLDAWQETVKNMFDSQTELTQSWAQNFKSIDGLPDQAIKSVERFQEMAKHWSGTQEDLWAKWFEMLNDFDPSQASEKWTDALKNPLKAWQEQSQRVLDAQAEWMKIWTGASKEAAKD